MWTNEQTERKHDALIRRHCLGAKASKETVNEAPVCSKRHRKIQWGWAQQNFTLTTYFLRPPITLSSSSSSSQPSSDLLFLPFHPIPHLTAGAKYRYDIWRTQAVILLRNVTQFCCILTHLASTTVTSMTVNCHKNLSYRRGTARRSM